MSRTYRFAFVVECASEGRADTQKVEELLDLALKDLIYDDSFIEALGETEAVTIQLIPIPESFESPEA
jgi:hypothetical protein